RGLRSGPLLAAAVGPIPVSVPKATPGEPAGMNNLPRSFAPITTVAANSCHVPGETFDARSTTERRALWDQRFETPDPWNYDASYEQRKYEQTLQMLADETIGQALELACAEGHFTEKLASRVESLAAIDISERALERARFRCRSHGNIQFRFWVLIDDEIPGNMDLIVCSEVLYFLEDTDMLRRISEKLTRALAPGGRLVTRDSL